MTYLPSLTDSGSSFPLSINDRGEIAGSSEAPDGTRHAVLWRDGAIVDLGLLPGSFNTVATSINERGQVVGFALDLLNPGIHNRAFLWEDGRMIELAPMPGRAWAIASAINDHGESSGSRPTRSTTGTARSMDARRRAAECRWAAAVAEVERRVADPPRGSDERALQLDVHARPSRPWMVNSSPCTRAVPGMSVPTQSP